MAARVSRRIFHLAELRGVRVAGRKREKASRGRMRVIRMELPLALSCSVPKMLARYDAILDDCLSRW